MTMATLSLRAIISPLRSSRTQVIRSAIHGSNRISNSPQHLLRFNGPLLRSYASQRGYNRFGRSTGTSFLRRWAARPTFYYEVAGFGGMAGGIYLYNVETVPVSNRRRFNIISPERERSMAHAMYEQLLQEYQGRILPENHPQVQRIRKVLARLLEGMKTLEAGHGVSSSWREGLDGWEVNVLVDDQANAFVLPGNKVFVFTGILPICESEAGIATVLGHEMAHNVAHHSAEKMSSAFVISGLLFVLWAFLGLPDFGQSILLDLGFLKPGSRRQESEADYIGLLMMAGSCYNPEEAITLWERFQKAERGKVPQFMSTHPSDQTRITQFKHWMPIAQERYNDSECSVTAGFARDFGQVWRGSNW